MPPLDTAASQASTRRASTSGASNRVSQISESGKRRLVGGVARAGRVTRRLESSGNDVTGPDSRSDDTLCECCAALMYSQYGGEYGVKLYVFFCLSGQEGASDKTPFSRHRQQRGEPRSRPCPTRSAPVSVIPCIVQYSSAGLHLPACDSPVYRGCPSQRLAVCDPSRRMLTPSPLPEP